MFEHQNRGFVKQDAGITRDSRIQSILTRRRRRPTNLRGEAINNGNIKGLSDLSRPPTSGETSDTWSDDAVMSAAKCARGRVSLWERGEGGRGIRRDERR